MTPDEFDKLQSQFAVYQKHCYLTGLEWAEKASISDFTFEEIKDELWDSIPALIAEIEQLHVQNRTLKSIIAMTDPCIHQQAVDEIAALAFQNAPDDDEPETDEERVAVAEAREDIRAGLTRAWADVERESTAIQPEKCDACEWCPSCQECGPHAGHRSIAELQAEIERLRALVTVSAEAIKGQ